MSFSPACLPATLKLPSSRRAWIEILTKKPCVTPMLELPSSRRAWIEIALISSSVALSSVALLAEGVDRNPVT